ncbi:hypothetical protein Gotri_025829 [Gossypium trilobum]|uniref:Uncharacterized protein n=1 Tax=Gossypium trilobum TaxID=34281 RepID=A0A7J9FRW3_9ROSI|nr:hypothetical protein [Gossypium trilobum]
MEKGFLDKVENNVAVRIWSEKIQQKKGDSLTEGYVSELWDFTSISVDLVPTVEECTTLFRWPRIQADKAYSRAANILTILNKLMSITGMSEQWVAARIKQKGDRKCVEKVSYRVFSENYSPLKEFVATPRRDNISKEKWMEILQSLQDKDYRLRQFILTTQGLAQCEFAYKGDNYKKKLRNTRPIEEHLQVIPSELEIVKQDFEKRSSELGKKIEHLEEKKMQLGLDVDVQKLEAKKMKKRKEQG